MAEQEMIRGTVAAVLYQNDSDGYSVLRFHREDGEILTVVGIIPLCTQGEQLVITGHWENHPSHGPQFRAEFLERLMPDGAAEIEKYLASRAIRGIGPTTAARIVRRFGNETFAVM